MVTSWMSFCKTCVLAVALSMLLAGCSINGDATGASSDSATSESSSENGSAGGQKLAASLSEWIEQRESQGNIAESQKTILDKAKSTGEISTSDYEKAWSDYRQCMIDKGYKEIKLIKYPSGLYAEAGHKQGTTIQESRYSDDSTECGDEYVADVQDVYGIIVGNPNLDDEIWGGSLPYNHKGMKGSMQWAEFCVGIRAHVWKALYMGWSLRFKFKLSASADEYGDPWYVPGFGKYGSNTMGVTYTITYKLPL